MYYGDKREAKVRIMHKLVESGWKAFGYSPDQSDSMTDYYHPADWSGIATKNGYVLLIDICNYNLSLSGKEEREYIYNSKRTVSNERITKLTAMMNDAASTENEKASCAVLIEKEKEKAGVEPEYTVKEVYPTFSHANPKGTSWHIEKDGQIIAKGKGVFSTNTYDWENKEKTAAEQKEEKITAFVSRVEKVLSDSDALQAEVIKVPVKTIQTVEKAVTAVTDADIKEGFTIVMKVGYTHGKSKGNKYTYINNGVFSKLGKNNKPSKSFDKMWSLSVTRINELLSKGHIAVIEFIEVTQYVEKTVFKKTARKQTVSNAPQIETPEATASQETESAHRGSDNSNEVTLTINEEKNGIELKFNGKPSSDIITSLKENGFRWSSYGGKWWAKQTEERLAFAQSLINGNNSVDSIEEVEPEQTATGGNTEAQDNVIHYNFSQTETTETEGKEVEGMVNTYDDIFSKFDNITITAEQKISNEDLEFCNEQEEIYKKTIAAYKTFNAQLQIIAILDKEHGQKFGKKTENYFHAQNTAFYYSMSKHDYEKAISDIKNAFIMYVCSYFERKYNITIDEDKVKNKYGEDITYNNIIDEIFIQLDGFNFTEKAEQEIKSKAKDIFYSNDKITIRNNKLILDGHFAYHDSIWKEYRLTGKHESILMALSHFEDGNTNVKEELSNKYFGYNNERSKDNYDKYEVQTLSKVKTIKFLKNGKMEIEFLSNQVASKFANEYCGYNQQSA
ncbi:hypothetical protein SAMN04487895_101707 [Paenibacillus sophorae]|uniref:Uncharacterized protein n=1 Tax=Paenibacillus sophorae TaxID=1333845 RepID=A0A1H8H0B8_9BACL|nr:hypothetical protein [Paenibacillus sophorae]QWU14398.1 hypothetical protein KP014_21050 [Paenibacillus sophorae]SEN49575.1 hypothetical protein SAMN04487895_101707 [Paenibacillus sophorae]